MDSPLEGAGFEPSVPVLGGSVCRVMSLFGLRGIRRRNEGLDSVRLARSGCPPQSMELIFFRHPAHCARVLGYSVYDAVGNGGRLRDSLISRINSLMARFNSLLGRINSLFRCVGNCLVRYWSNSIFAGVDA